MYPTSNLHYIEAACITAGYCTYKDRYILNLDDYLNMYELIIVNNENEYRISEHQKRKNKGN